MSASILGALCLFASVCVVCAISAFTLPIETKGRALQVSCTGLSYVPLQPLYPLCTQSLAYGNPLDIMIPKCELFTVFLVMQFFLVVNWSSTQNGN